MNWIQKIFHVHDFVIHRIDFQGPFSSPRVKEAHISFCKTCKKMRVEEYSSSGFRLTTTYL